jgi:hypothetical protein
MYTHSDTAYERKNNHNVMLIGRLMNGYSDVFKKGMPSIREGTAEIVE